jgi:hypothetical protein
MDLAEDLEQKSWGTTMRTSLRVLLKLVYELRASPPPQP